MTRPTRGSSAEGGSLSRERERRLDALCERLGRRFERSELLRQALTHPSRANEEGEPAASNERLEFLGDAVLGLVVAELSMAAHPRATEGELTHARANAVNRFALAERALSLGLDALVLLGRGEARNGGRAKDSILAHVVEAVLGALYLDAGFEATRAFLARELGAELAELVPDARDAKTQLQQLLHAAGRPHPLYVTVAESGPAHAREFGVEVRICQSISGKGAGPSKQAAEQAAAADALRALASEPS